MRVPTKTAAGGISARRIEYGPGLPNPFHHIAPSTAATIANGARIEGQKILRHTRGSGDRTVRVGEGLVACMRSVYHAHFPPLRMQSRYC
jgi:hypothetical protein